MLKLQLNIQRNYKIFFFFKYFQKTEVYLEPSQISKMELFVKIATDLMLLTIFTKSSIVDVWLGLTLAAIWLNIFSYYFINFISSNIQKRSSTFLLQDLTFIFIQANIYVKTCTGMKISRCRQDKTIPSDNFKTNFIILIWKSWTCSTFSY